MSIRRAGSTSEAVKEEEVVMGTNQAYETVEMRYQSASRSEQPSLHHQEQSTITDQEEPVYENN